MADLIYSTNIGCASARDSGGGSPGQCQGREQFAVVHRYRFPRPHQARLFVCAHHAERHPTAEPLNDNDRRVIAARRARRAEQMARVTVGPYAGQSQT